MKKLLIPGLAAATAITLAPLAHAGPNQGDQCMDWHATTTGPDGRTMTCTHLGLNDGDSGHIMYWEYGGARDSAYHHDNPPMTSPAVRPGVRCDSRLPHILTVDPETGNAIHPYAPSGCDRSLPMLGGDR
jgi:hypothetical protein